jgi:hypothetical protein
LKRRNFILASGSTVLSGIVTSRIQRPAIGLNFEISTPDKNPSEVNSLVIDFETLQITPQYIDERESISVQAEVEVAGSTKQSNRFQTSVENGETKELKDRIDALVVDGLNVSRTISGNVTISIDHPDIQDSYARQFNITSSGISESVVDNFEQILYEAENRNVEDVYGGDITGWSRQQSTVFEGDYALESPSDGTNRHIADTDQLPTIKQGDTVSYRVYNQNVGDIQITFGNQNETGYGSYSNYTIKYDPAFPAFALKRYDNGSRTVLDNDLSTSLPSDEWVEIVVDWGADGLITATIYDESKSQVTTVSKTDGTYISGGIGYRYQTDGPHFIDEVRFIE